MSIFEGSGVAIVTPFLPDGSVDYPGLTRLVERQIEHGTDAIIVCGTTGEPSTMPEAEHIKVIEHVIKVTDKRKPVIAGTGSNCTDTAIELSRESEALGADGLLLVTPYYNKCSQEGLVRHYLNVADAVSIPMILYNVPSRTGVNILPATCARMADHENVAAIKEACGDISQITELARLIEGRMDLYSGNDDQTTAIMALGGKGVISVVANILPKEMHELAAAALAGDFARARELQFYLNPLEHALFMDVSPIPTKMALSLMGLCGPHMRLPLCELTDDKMSKLKEVMKGYDLI